MLTRYDRPHPKQTNFPVTPVMHVVTLLLLVLVAGPVACRYPGSTPLTPVAATATPPRSGGDPTPVLPSSAVHGPLGEEHVLVADDSGQLHAIGSLTNNGNVPIVVEEITGTLSFGRGGQSQRTMATVGPQVVWPGGSSPFRISFPGRVSEHVEAEVELSTSEYTRSSLDGLRILEESSGYSFVDQSGFYHLVGEVANNGSQSVILWLDASLYDRDARLLDAASTTIPFYVLAPGEVQPFGFDDFPVASNRIDTGGKVSDYRVDVNLLRTMVTTANVVYPEVTAQSLEDVGGYALVRGVVKNTHSSSVRNPLVTVTLRDPGGIVVVGTGYTRLPTMLAPDEEAEFATYVATDPDLGVGSLLLDVQAQGLPIDGEPDPVRREGPVGSRENSDRGEKPGP